MKTNYNKALDNLLVGIGNDYDRWNNVDYLDDEVLDSDNKRMKEIKTKSAIKFKEGLRVKPGRKFDKIMHGTSVWGFVAKKMVNIKVFLILLVMYLRLLLGEHQLNTSEVLSFMMVLIGMLGQVLITYNELR